MDAVEEAPCHVINNETSPVAKGKRTKRLRPQSPIPATSEEEDTARCLILLAQGYFSNNHNSQSAAYACKTCNRVFSSFQALGGHRTSHKKPKIEKKPPIFYDIDHDFSSRKRIPPPHSLSLQLSSSFKPYPSPRTHECSYCGAEFTSGQALGGHMRRHRAAPISPVPGRAGVKSDPVPNKSRDRLSLDLNFPAPEDENPKFEFGSGRPTNTPTLVDCHF